MFEFIRTETGWRVFWGIDPLVEAQAAEGHAATRACTAPTEDRREAPLLILAEAAGLRPMAV